MFDFTQSDEGVMYQILQASTSGLQQGVEDHAGCSGTVGLGVHQTIIQHKQQGVQLLLGQTLTDDLKHQTQRNTDTNKVRFIFRKRASGYSKLIWEVSVF